MEKQVSGIRKMDDIRTRYYIKFLATDKPGVLAKVSGILAKYNISIASVNQKERCAVGAVPVVIMTHESLEKDMAKALREIKALPVIDKKLVRIRVED